MARDILYLKWITTNEMCYKQRSNAKVSRLAPHTEIKSRENILKQNVHYIGGIYKSN